MQLDRCTDQIPDAVKTAVQDAECQLVIIGTSCDAGYMATLRKRLQSLGKICILQGTVSVNDLPGANKHRTVFSPVFRTISEASQPSKKEEFEEVSRLHTCRRHMLTASQGLTIRQQYGNLYAYPRSLARPAETSALTKPHTPRDDLPRIGIDGMVPLNAAGQRLDLVTPRTIKKDWKPFLRLNSIHALCRDHHILGQCSKPDCPYDHAVIDASQLACVKTLAKRTPCTKGLFCRRVNCYKGHVCQCADCYYTGTRHKTCIMPKKMHAVDCKVDSWITLPESAGEPGLTVRHNSSTCDTASTGYRTANDGTFASEGSVSTEQSHATTDNNNSGFAANASTTSAGSLSTWNTLRAQNGSVSTLSSWMPSMTLSQWHRSLSGLHDNSSVPGSGFGGDGEPEAEVYRAKQSGEPKAAAEVSEDLDYDLIDLSG